jgi:hypothetical protein
MRKLQGHKQRRKAGSEKFFFAVVCKGSRTLFLLLRCKYKASITAMFMKRSKVILLLGVLLLCGILLHAANNNKPFTKFKKTTKKTTEVEMKKDMEFIPGSIFL